MPKFDVNYTNVNTLWQNFDILVKYYIDVIFTNYNCLLLKLHNAYQILV